MAAPLFTAEGWNLLILKQRQQHRSRCDHPYLAEKQQHRYHTRARPRMTRTRVRARGPTMPPVMRLQGSAIEEAEEMFAAACLQLITSNETATGAAS